MPNENFKIGDEVFEKRVIGGKYGTIKLLHEGGCFSKQAGTRPMAQIEYTNYKGKTRRKWVAVADLGRRKPATVTEKPPAPKKTAVLTGPKLGSAMSRVALVGLLMAAVPPSRSRGNHHVDDPN